MPGVLDKAVDFVVKHLDQALTIIFVLAFDGCRLDHHVDRMNDAEKHLVFEKDRLEADAQAYVAHNPGKKISKVFQKHLDWAEQRIEEAGNIHKEVQMIEGDCLPCFRNFPRQILPSYNHSRKARNLTDSMVELKDILRNKLAPDGGGDKYRMYDDDDVDIVNLLAAQPSASDPGSSNSSHVISAAMADQAVAHLDGGSGSQAKTEASRFRVVLDGLWDLVREDSMIGYIGVHGMAGVGKTHLLRALFNKFASETHTFKVMTITVGEKLDVARIQEAMTGELGQFFNPNTASKDLFDSLTQKEKYVILFDDVWEKLPLQSIGIPDPKENPKCCKVVVATRLQGVCSETQTALHLECMSPEESWKLFEETVGENARELFRSKQKVKDAAKELVMRCEGLPRAVIAVAQAMRGKKSKGWKDAARDMKEQPWNVPGIAYSVLREFQRSYDNLASDALKSSFAYFCMYPEGESLTSKWCADYWIGEGTVTDYEDMDAAVAKARSMAYELQYAGLLDSDWRPHGMARAMAFWVGSDHGSNQNKWMVMPASDLIEAPPTERWSEAERVSFSRNSISSWPEEPHCPHLLSLLLWKSVQSCRLPDNFFRFMSALRVLELSSSFLKELPPSIGELYALRFLDVSNSDLVSLPKELGKLGELRLLNLQKTYSLKNIPRGIFEGLLKLEVLRMDNSYNSWETDEDNTGTGAHAHELVNLTRMKQLDVMVDKKGALDIMATSPALPSALRCISLSSFRGTKTIRIPGDIGPNTTILEWVTMSDFIDLEELVFHGGEASDGRSYSLNKLYYLTLERLDRLKRIVWKGPAAFDCSLSSLYELKIQKCSQIEELVGVAEETSGSTFPKLAILYLIELPALRTISNQTLGFPSLRKFWVDKCPKVMRLPLGAHSGKNLEKIWGNRQWWDGLEWGSEAVKSTFEPFFEEYN